MCQVCFYSAYLARLYLLFSDNQVDTESAMLGVRDENTPSTFAGQMGRVRGPCCSCECATEYSVDGVIVNEEL